MKKFSLIILFLPFLLLACSSDEVEFEGPIPDNATYEIAKQTGELYSCKFSIPGFFGSQNPATAEIRGTDYQIEERYDQLGGMAGEYALLDGVAYAWHGGGIKQDDGTIERYIRGEQVEIAPVAKEYKKFFDTDFKPEWLFIGLGFPAVPDYAKCERIPERQLKMPDIEFNEMTEFYVKGVEKSFEQVKELVDKLPFTTHLPDDIPEPFETFEMEVTSEPGNTDPGRETITYQYRMKPRRDQQFQYLALGESKLSDKYDPPANCQMLPTLDWESRGAGPSKERYPCTLAGETPKGHQIYRGKHYSEQAYFVALDNVLVIIRSTLPEDDIIGLVDDLKKVDNDELYTLFGSVGVAVAPELPPKEPEPPAPLDTSPAPFTVYMPEFIPEKYELSSAFLKDRGGYEGSNQYASFFYLANANMVNEAKYELEQEQVTDSYNPPESCGRANFEFKKSYDIAGECEQVGETTGGEPVYFWSEAVTGHYFVLKGETVIHLWNYPYSANDEFYEKTSDFYYNDIEARIDPEDAVDIFSSLRPASTDEVAQLREGILPEWV